MNRRFALVSVAAIAVGAATIWLAQVSNAPKTAILPTGLALPDFELFDQNGHRFTKENLKGKFTVATFIFTRCPSACPVMTSKMAELCARYQNGPDAQFISITVDPENDSQETLRRYAQAFDAIDGRWKFLRRDSLQAIVDLCEKGFRLAAENLPSGHPTKFIVIDANATIRAYYDYDDPKLIDLVALTLRELAKEFPRVKAVAD